jgi:hypothetical protein
MQEGSQQVMPATLTFTAQEKSDLTTHLGIAGGSSDAQIQAALLDQARGGARKVQTTPPPPCPVCGRPLLNNKNPAST